MKTPTVHIGAKRGEIAPTVLLPGDPLRAKFIAETFLAEVRCYSTVRGMLGFTGLYKGERVSVQGSGMGSPSMAIYAYELIHAYEAKRLIRVGSTGALHPSLAIGDLIGATAACYDADYKSQFNLPGSVAAVASYPLLKEAEKVASELELILHMGPVLTSDVFYHKSGSEALIPWREMGVLAVEMEAASLYLQAQRGGVDALTLLTVSDLPFHKEEMSSAEREKSLTEMITIALEVATSSLPQ